MKKIFLAAACAAVMLASCNGGKKYDEAISKYDTIVTEAVAAMESGDQAAADAAMAKLDEIKDVLADTTKMSDDQKKKLLSISERLTNGMMNALNNAADQLDEAAEGLDEAAEELDAAAEELDAAAAEEEEVVEE